MNIEAKKRLTAGGRPSWSPQILIEFGAHRVYSDFTNENTLVFITPAKSANSLGAENWMRLHRLMFLKQLRISFNYYKLNPGIMCVTVNPIPKETR
jgi:hypothetical protein